MTQWGKILIEPFTSLWTSNSPHQWITGTDGRKLFLQVTGKEIKSFLRWFDWGENRKKLYSIYESKYDNEDLIGLLEKKVFFQKNRRCKRPIPRENVYPYICGTAYTIGDNFGKHYCTIKELNPDVDCRTKTYKCMHSDGKAMNGTQEAPLVFIMMGVVSSPSPITVREIRLVPLRKGYVDIYNSQVIVNVIGN